MFTIFWYYLSVSVFCLRPCTMTLSSSLAIATGRPIDKRLRRKRSSEPALQALKERLRTWLTSRPAFSPRRPLTALLCRGCCCTLLVTLSSSAHRRPRRSDAPPMDTQRPPRPRRPTRDIPSTPVDNSQPETESPAHSANSDQTFSTPLSSPLDQDQNISTSPTQEHPSDTFPDHRTDHPPQLEPEEQTAEDKAAELTPLRAHYLKKELIQLQFRREFRALLDAPSNNVSTFSYLGPPFTPPPKDGPRLDLPFLRYIFRQFVLSFPFLAAAPKNFFPEKLQPFLASLLSRNLSQSSVMDDDPDNSEEAARFKVLTKLERNFTMLMTSGTKLAEKEDVVRLTQADLERLERLAKKRAAKEAKGDTVFEVNIVCIRTVIERGRMRSKAHEVRRKYSTFVDLCDWDITGIYHSHPTR